MDDELGVARVEHLRSFLGEPVRLVEDVHDGVRFDVLLFPPTGRVPHATLVTDGLSDVGRRRGGGSGRGGEQELVRSELLLGLPAGWPGTDASDGSLLEAPASSWPVTVLRETARLSLDEERALEWGTTVGGPEFRDLVPAGVPFGGVLVGPPLAYPGDLALASTPVGEVRYHGALLVTPDELDHALAVPYGSSGLLERLWQAGVSAVVDPGRAGVVDGPPPWTVHVLLGDSPDHLGQVLDHDLPALSAALAEDRATSYLMPLDEVSVQLRLTGPMDVHRVLQDAGWTDADAPLHDAVPTHRRTVELAPVGGRGLEALVAVLALVRILAERRHVVAVWLPQQGHLATPQRLVQEMDDIDVSFRVHPFVEVPDTVTTRGLEALGGLEVRFTAPRLSAEDRRRRLRRVLQSRPESRDMVLPAAGQRGRHGFSRYALVEAVDPRTAERYLELVDGGWRGRFDRQRGRGPSGSLSS
ncbi:hypothetical protein GC722_17205 [Auraticoccus sp. F435]|uniref:Suppressor of fused-like domain-containing protein n=1 Tax=Auraticoccus cholistanensis TaxID=2656650 RepID=A0A6A9V2C8_9ACTN|nr:suppressor of fused domain protein [Auraticoccus cholistanensis]MVA77737.1 hypothetical protein [Auraticoccus cholistanensis]